MSTKDSGSAKKQFASADEAFSYILSFVNLEKGQDIGSLRLDRVRFLCDAFGNPEKSFKCFHVAGSKGKGSTAAMIASALSSAGFRTGLYTSPHVSSFTERISLSGQPFEDSSYAEEGSRIKAFVASKRPGEWPGGAPPTFFELMTLLGFLVFRREACSYAAIEVGLGGRLDATNVVSPLASLITRIELEHTEILGHTIPLIAAEKAGIIKPGIPVFIGAQEVEARIVFEKIAAERGSELFSIEEEALIGHSTIDPEGTRVSIRFRDSSLFPGPLELKLSLIGEVQAGNAALAALALRKSLPSLPVSAITKGLSGARLPARFEILSRDPPVVADGAHTPLSVGYALQSFSCLFPGKSILLFGCAADKDIDGMAALLSGRFDRIIVTKPGSFKKSDPRKAAASFASLGSPAELVEDTDAAIGRAIELSKTEGKALLATGSFYLASALRERMKG